MPSSSPHRLVVLSGPSCVGKSPLERALARFFPELHRGLQPLTLYNSRAPRPGEVDGVHYHFRPAARIESLRSEKRYVVMEVRGDLQALDLDDLSARLDEGDVLFEGNPFVGKTLLTHPRLEPFERLSIFMAPLSKQELEYLRAPERNCALEALVTDVMRRKLLRRTRKQKLELSLPDLQNIEKRAGSAYRELKDACHFGHVIVNHDGEESDNWDAFYFPLGDARRALTTFVALLEGREASAAERWPEDLLP